jgi:hypothetical protein
MSGASSGAGGSSNGQQQQQQQGRQQQGRRPQPASPWQQQLQQLDAEAAAVAPDLDKMSAGALKEFLKQVGAKQ